MIGVSQQARRAEEPRMARQAKDAQNWRFGVRTRPWPTEFLSDLLHAL